MWHHLRHTYASVLAAGGVKRHEVEQLLGHAGGGTTGLYTHLFRESYTAVHRALDAVFAAIAPGHPTHRRMRDNALRWSGRSLLGRPRLNRRRAGRRSDEPGCRTPAGRPVHEARSGHADPSLRVTPTRGRADHAGVRQGTVLPAIDGFAQQRRWVPYSGEDAPVFPFRSFAVGGARLGLARPRRLDSYELEHAAPLLRSPRQRLVTSDRASPARRAPASLALTFTRSG
jgi:Phage integrase family